MKRLLLALLLVAPVAVAQPMMGPNGMPDPTKMSGIPRPDPEVPPLTLTVRVARGDFAHSLPGIEVKLDGPDGPKVAKTDAAGRATFADLKSGETYVAHATAFGQTLSSQEVQMPDQPGVRMALVFAAPPGTPDGVARATPDVPVGTLVLRVVDEDDKPLVGLPALIVHQRQGANTEQWIVATDDKGEVRRSGLPVSQADGYVVAVERDGSRTRSQPFVLQSDHGTLVALRALKTTRDPKAVTIDKRSHFILEVKDDEVDVVENLFLVNQSTSPFDPGPQGVRLPLPDGAEQAQLAPNGPPELKLEEGLVTFRGTLRPGETVVSFGFTLPVHDGAATLRQKLPFTLERVAVITDHYDGMEVAGTITDKETRSLSGREFWVASGPQLAAGQPVEVTLTGLPTRPTWMRTLAVAVAILIALWGLIAAIGRRGSGPSRLRLEQERLQMLDQIAALPAEDPRRAELVGRLERVYRELDGSTGAT